jgi:hypothetical protein
MSLSRSIAGSFIVSGLILASASSLSAQSRHLFSWTGNVERETIITMRGFEGRAQAGRNTSRGSLVVNSALPRDEGRVSVRLERGHADVDVLQQPDYRNGFTTIVRVRDNTRGNDRVRLAAYWSPDDRRYGRGDVYDRNDRRDHDGPWGSRGRGSSALRWSGEVDSEIEIRIRGNSVTYRTLSGNTLRSARIEGPRGIPRANGQIVIDHEMGRGSVSVIEQPSARNDYTAVIRVHDPRSGYGRYEFDVRWIDRDYDQRVGSRPAW